MCIRDRGICKKAKELGAKVITLSGPDGYVYDPDGVSTDEKVEYLLETVSYTHLVRTPFSKVPFRRRYWPYR